MYVLRPSENENKTVKPLLVLVLSVMSHLHIFKKFIIVKKT